MDTATITAIASENIGAIIGGVIVTGLTAFGVVKKWSSKNSPTQQQKMASIQLPFLPKPNYDKLIEEGFGDFCNDMFSVLFESLSKLKELYIGYYIAYLKTNGMPHGGIRYSPTVKRYIRALKIAIDEKVEYRATTIIFRNSFPKKEDLDALNFRILFDGELGDIFKSDPVFQWYQRKIDDILGELFTGLEEEWDDEFHSAKDFWEASKVYSVRDTLVLSINMFEAIRQKKEAVFDDMGLSEKGLSGADVSAEWKRLSKKLVMQIIGRR